MVMMDGCGCGDLGDRQPRVKRRKSQLCQKRHTRFRTIRRPGCENDPVRRGAVPADRGQRGRRGRDKSEAASEWESGDGSSNGSEAQRTKR